MFRKESLTFKQNFKRSVFSVFHLGAKSGIYQSRMAYNLRVKFFFLPVDLYFKKNVKNCQETLSMKN